MKTLRLMLVILIPVFLISLLGCSQLPGTRSQQGAVIGGAGGAAAGALIGGSEHRLLGTLIGGALGATGGYLVGAQTDKIKNNDTSAAQTAVQNAQTTPATVAEVRNSNTADLNHDGFVTTDEVIAMSKAGLTDQQMFQRLRATGQVFELTQAQQQYLINQGVPAAVVDQMNSINRQSKEQLLQSNVISRQPANP
jgi:hypothetical protein